MTRSSYLFLAASLALASCAPIFRGPEAPLVLHPGSDTLVAIEQPGWFRVLAPSQPTTGTFEIPWRDQTLSFATLTSAGQGYAVFVMYGEMQRMNDFGHAPEAELRDLWRGMVPWLTDMTPVAIENTPRFARLGSEATMPPHTRFNHTAMPVRSVVRVVVTRSRMVIAFVLRNAANPPSEAFARGVQSLEIATP